MRVVAGLIAFIFIATGVAAAQESAGSDTPPQEEEASEAQPENEPNPEEEEEEEEEEDSADDETSIFGDPFAAPSEEEAAPSDDFESLFETDEMIETSDPEVDLPNPADDLLQREGVRWGGRLGGSLSADWQWDNITRGGTPLTDPSNRSLRPSLGGSLFFDARPQPEFRAYGKLAFDLETAAPDLLDVQITPEQAAAGLPEGWTAEENENGDTEIRDDTGTLIFTLPADGADAIPGVGEDDSVGQAPGLGLSVSELFFDYTWEDALFFRFGKHTIAWGAGYFFSPADVLNLTAVDPEDPTADREGPVSLRTGYPFGLTGSATLYVIVNQGIEPRDVAIASLVEFVAGPGELGLGAYYQRALAPRLMSLYTASVGDTDLFGEAVLLVGSDRVFVRPSSDQSAANADPDDGYDLVVETYTEESKAFLQATLGGRYLYQFEEGGTLLLAGQYFFNGEGYGGDVAGLLPAAARLALNPTENGRIILNPAAQPEGYEPPPALGFDDLANFGRHYGVATMSLSGLPWDRLSFSLFGLVNLSDLSGIVSPNISVSFLDRFSASASLRFTLGPPDGEFTDPASLFLGQNPTPTAGLTVSISMPGGSF